MQIMTDSKTYLRRSPRLNFGSFYVKQRLILERKRLKKTPINSRGNVVAKSKETHHLKTDYPKLENVALLAKSKETLADDALISGCLEHRENGLRFVVTDNEGSISQGKFTTIFFNNISHAIFQQPSTFEDTLVLFFELKNTKQLFNFVDQKSFKIVCPKFEVMKSNESLDEEWRNGEKWGKRIKDFESFCEDVQKLGPLNFEEPTGGNGFYGFVSEPVNDICSFYGTAECIVSTGNNILIPLEDIEIVVFERVGCGLRYFDMVIVFSDYYRKVFRVQMIPRIKLGMIQNWLTKMKILHFQCQISLVWERILQHISGSDDWKPWDVKSGWKSFLGPDETQSEDDDSICYENGLYF